jgi:hypothetical protein
MILAVRKTVIPRTKAAAAIAAPDVWVKRRDTERALGLLYFGVSVAMHRGELGMKLWTMAAGFFRQRAHCLGQALLKQLPGFECFFRPRVFDNPVGGAAHATTSTG